MTTDTFDSRFKSMLEQIRVTGIGILEEGSPRMETARTIREELQERFTIAAISSLEDLGVPDNIITLLHYLTQMMAAGTCLGFELGAIYSHVHGLPEKLVKMAEAVKS